MPWTGVGGTSASPPSSQHPGHAPSFLLLQHTQPFQPQGLCTPCYLNTTSPGSFPPILQASVPAVHPEGLFSDPITSSLLTYTRSSLCLPFALLSLEDTGVCICMSRVSHTEDDNHYEGRDYPSCSPLCLQPKEQYPAHSRCSVNICWMRSSVLGFAGMLGGHSMT